jgi:hypothetical protein
MHLLIIDVIGVIFLIIDVDESTDIMRIVGQVSFPLFKWITRHLREF